MVNGIRILHVDDDPDICSLTALQLEKLTDTFSVETRTNPHEALATLADEPCDCLVSDFDMPEMNGLELFDTVRADYPELPFILFTGKGSEEIASRAISAGVTGYLQKGTGTEQYEMLANRITNAVDWTRSKGALADSQRRLGLLVDESPFAVIEWTTDLEVTRWNDAATEIFGYSGPEAMGRHISFLFPESVDCDELGAELLEARGSYRGQQPSVTKDGDRVVGEWHNLTVTRDDAVLSMFSLVQDVTDRHDRQVELEQYETMVETVADGLYTLDEDLRFSTVNEGMVALTGYDREELVGSHLSLLIDDEDVARVNRDRKRTRESDSDTNTIDLTVETGDGRRLSCEVRYRLQRADGVFTGTAGVFRQVG